MPYIEGGDYLKWCAENLVVIVQIETVEAVEKIEEIASVPGVDCCYIGPMDLMLSMGEKEQGPGTKHEEAMMRVLKACKNQGVAAGLFCFDAKSVQMRIDQGWQFINCSSDGGHLAAASKADFESLKL
jgi:2-keto-3-deoxy-L-rhamnonate aldolase RhmA